MHSAKQTALFWNKMPTFGGKQMRCVGVLMLLVILLSGCVGGNARGLDVCAPWKPLYVTAEDRITPETAREIVAHNEVGERLCGWRAPGG